MVKGVKQEIQPNAFDRKVIDVVIQRCRSKNYSIFTTEFNKFYNNVVLFYNSAQKLTDEEIELLSKMEWIGVGVDKLIDMAKLFNNHKFAQSLVSHRNEHYYTTAFYKNPADFQFMLLFVSNTLILNVQKFRINITFEQFTQYVTTEPNIDLIDKIVRDTGYELPDTYKYYVAEVGTLQNLKNLMKQKFVLDDKCLEFACKRNDDIGIWADYECHEGNSNEQEKILFMLDNKLKPTSACWRNIIAYHKPDKVQYCAHINMLLEYGYVPTYSDILYALEHRIAIKNIGNYRFAFDDEYTKICSQIKATPYGTMGLHPTEECLFEACKIRNNTNVIRKLLEAVKPTTRCIEEACKIPGNYTVVKMLIKGGQQPNATCIKNLIHANCAAQLSELFDEYCKLEN